MEPVLIRVGGGGGAASSSELEDDAEDGIATAQRLSPEKAETTLTRKKGEVAGS